MTQAIGRYSELNGIPEVSQLEKGMDFRLPQYRREVFLKFYEFHTKYKSHPGGVYYLFPYLAERYEWDLEDKLWFAYINGNTQNPIMSWLIFNRYRTPQDFVKNDGYSWFDDNWARLQWDMDRRYQKKEFPRNVYWYLQEINQYTGGQEAFFREFEQSDRYETFQHHWKMVRNHFPTFGRLSAFSYLEYLRIMGLSLECDDLFLDDLSGSMSHRNGLAIVLGRDDLDWHGDNEVKYTPEMMNWLKWEANTLLREASIRIGDEASYFTLESALCTYKSWHRKNRRYPNVYNDMMHDRIKWAEAKWPEETFSMFWDAREEYLPRELRLEMNPNDPGLSPMKQNFYRENGIPIMMSIDFPEFDNIFDRMVWNAKAISTR